jgi:pimeloyl-ACP methyl ester carboxylesterase
MSRPSKLAVVSGKLALFAEQWGSGPAPLILGHGFGGSARNFRPQAREVATARRVILFDARGHARSDAPDDAALYEPECFVSDLLAILDAAGVERAVVGGLSMGAGVALRFALAHPERVAGLFLSAFPRAASAPGHREWALAFARDLEREGMERAGERHAWGTRMRSDPTAAELIRRGFLEHSAPALAHVLRRLIAVQPAPEELGEALARLAVPTAVLVGSSDAPSLDPSRALARCIPGARLHEIAGGHVINLENPQGYNRALGELLDRVGARG